MQQGRLVPPPPGSERRWMRRATHLLALGLPSLLVLTAALYGGASALFTLGLQLGAPGIFLAETVTVLAGGPVYYWIAAALAARLHAGGRGLVLPASLTPPPLMAPNWPIYAIIAMVWVAVWTPIYLFESPAFFDPTGRPAMTLAASLMIASSIPGAQLARLVGAQYLGVDGGETPADLSAADLALLRQVVNRFLHWGFLPLLLVFLPFSMIGSPMAILTSLPGAWVAFLLYLAIVDLYGGDSEVARARAPDAATAPSAG